MISLIQNSEFEKNENNYDILNFDTPLTVRNEGTLK